MSVPSLARFWSRLRGRAGAIGGLPSRMLGWAYARLPVGARRTGGAPALDWERLQELLAAVLELGPERRAAFLDHAAADDPALRREVESLVAAHQRPSILDRPPPPLRLQPPSVPEDPAPSLSRTASHYEVLERVGVGGMGVVYRARDRRLGRVVALKFLPSHLSADEESKERFLLEAKTAASLDHPNICTIYEAGESDDGQLFLAMPFYEGDTLKRRLERGALPVADALEIGAQVVAGLVKAHERGIVHRDIKPANIMITADGVVKIVDFGVAKLSDVPGMGRDAAIGTVAYMSPEQARGEEIDARTDLWSLGVVLYEMLTGERPFRGDYDRARLHAILTAEPPRMSLRRPNIPDAVADVVLRALAKPRDERYETAREMASAIDGLRDAARAGTALPPAGQAPASGQSPSAGVLAGGERRHVTVVVSMLSSYEVLVERLVPDALERIVAQLGADAEAVAQRHGGIVDHFAADRLVLVFGLPSSQEDDAVRAARAALDLHVRVAAIGAQLKLDTDGPLALHSGVDTGVVVARPAEGGRVSLVSGSAPQAAALLADHAGTDEVWVSSETRDQVEPYFELEARDALTLRGREPLVPYRLVRETGLQTRIEAAALAGLTAFTGRDAELGKLGRCLDQVRSGEGRLVLVTGEAGVGKSRLLHEFRRGLGSDEATVLAGRCQSYGGGVAYLPFIDILRSGLGVGADDVEGAVERMRSMGPSLEEFIPLYLHLLSIPSTSFPVPRHLRGDAFRLAMQDALAAILTLSVHGRPTVALLEDWHWADEASQAVLRQVAEVLPAHPLLVLVTSRPGYGGGWTTPGQATHLALNALDRTSTGVMLRTILDVHEVPAGLVHLIHERTGGNPFFIEETCQALLEEGSLGTGRDVAELAALVQRLKLPDSIQGVIRARLDRLPRVARDLLRLAAVTGREFAHVVLETASPDRSGLSEALDTLRAAGLVQQTRPAPDAEYRFRHVLTQEVAYAGLLEHQRRDLHGRVGLTLERLYGDRTDDHLDRLAHHYGQAESWTKAVRYGLRSAERANRLALYAEALQILERTQGWILRLPAGREREDALIDVLLRQERLCETLGRRAGQQQLIDRLIALLDHAADPRRLAEVCLRQGDLLTLLRRFGEAEEPLQRSLRLRRGLRDRVGERNTLRSLGLLRWHEGRNREALEIAEETLRIDRERGDVVAIVGDLTNCGAILRALGEHERVREVLEEALAVEQPDDATERDSVGDELAVKHVYALQHLANSYRERGDREKALECLRRAGAMAERKRLPVALAYHYTSLAHVYLQEGRIEESLERYRAAIELTRKARYASGLAQALRIYGEVLAGLGRQEEALPCLHEAAGTFAELGDPAGEGGAWSAIAAGEEILRHHAAALTAWGKAGPLLRRIEDRVGELEAVEGLARMTRLLYGDVPPALAHYRRGAQLAESLEDRAAEGRLRNVMGIIEWNRGEYPEALGHYERALALFSELGDETHAGLMLNSIGATLMSLGRSADAEKRLREALELHHRSGEGQLEGHALALIGDLFADREEIDEALGHYRRSLEVRRACGDRRGEGWMLHRVARCELARGEPARVPERLVAAARIAAECGDSELAAACEQLRCIPNQ